MKKLSYPSYEYFKEHLKKYLISWWSFNKFMHLKNSSIWKKYVDIFINFALKFCQSKFIIYNHFLQQGYWFKYQNIKQML